MSFWSKQRMFILNILFICIFVPITAFSLFFFIYEKPTCFDGLQNQTELGIDCGGPCANICRLVEKDLIVELTRAFKLQDGLYSAIALVKNVNADIGAYSVPFEFNFYDDKGILVNSAITFTNINPGGITPIFIPYVKSDERTILNSNLRFLQPPKWVKVERIKIDVIDIEVFQEGELKVIANIRNIGKALKNTFFVVLLSNSEGNIIASSRTYVEELKKNEVQKLIYTWVHPLSIDDSVCKKMTNGCNLEVVNVTIHPVESHE